MTMDLIEFLRARLDDDEQTARAASPGPWHVDSDIYAESIDNDEGSVLAGGRWGGEASIFESNEDARHITRHDPVRALAEVDAKRRILDLEVPDHYDTPGEWRGWHDVHGDVLRLLALPYTDHPDYREEWRP